MDREIKFRGKQINNGEWVEGDLFRNFDGRVFVGELIVTDYRGTADDRFDLGIGFDEIDPSTVCQHTGLEDKNGKEIYEGDIVKCVDINSGAEFTAVVEFGNPNHEYSWGWQLRHIKGDKPNLDILLWIDMEETGASCAVIGNIFENSELLNPTESEVS